MWTVEVDGRCGRWKVWTVVKGVDGWCGRRGLIVGVDGGGFMGGGG